MKCIYEQTQRSNIVFSHCIFYFLHHIMWLKNQTNILRMIIFDIFVDFIIIFHKDCHEFFEVGF